MKTTRHSLVNRLWREVIFAEFEQNRKLRQLVPYWVSSPRKYTQMTVSQQRLERLGFWFELSIFGSFTLIMILLCVASPSDFITSFTESNVPAKSGFLVLLPIAVYRTLTRQGYLRWMYTHRHR